MNEESSLPSDVKPPSERSFGVVFAAVFMLVALYPLLKSQPVRTWSLAVAAIFAALAWLLPAVLRPLNLLWFRFGLLLHKIVNPVVMGAIFFAVILPSGLLMRVFRKDPLKLKRDPNAITYWTRRDPPGPTGESLKHLF